MAVVPADQHLLRKARASDKGKNERTIEAMAKKLPPKMNEWEKRLYEWVSTRPHVLDCGYQRIRLLLPSGGYYKPDVDAWFAIHHMAAGIGIPELHVFEVKGFLRAAERMRLEQAAATYPQIVFWVVYQSSEGGTADCPFKIARIRR